MVRNSFRDRKEGYTDKAVVIRLVLSLNSTHMCVYNKVVLRHSVIIHMLFSSFYKKKKLLLITDLNYTINGQVH